MLKELITQAKPMTPVFQFNHHFAKRERFQAMRDDQNRLVLAFLADRLLDQSIRRDVDAGYPQSPRAQIKRGSSC